MQEPERQSRCACLAQRPAGIQIPVIRENGGAVVRIDDQRILRRRMRKMIQRRIDSGEENKEADNQENESFEKSFHVGSGAGPYRNVTTMPENRSVG